MKSLFFVLAVASGANAQVVWDYGIDAAAAGGGSYSGCWSSQAAGQNFTDNAQFNTSMNIYGMTYDSCFPGLNGLSFQIKVESDANNDGVPDTSEALFSANAISETLLGNFNGQDIYRYEFSFSTVTQPAGDIWYWGVSGNGFEAAQTSHINSNLPLFNNQMHQYSGNNYSNSAQVGDQAFQLIGEIPAPGAAALLGLAGVMAGRRRR
jgi:uncharacterized protein (TIGR03382 family)